MKRRKYLSIFLILLGSFFVFSKESFAKVVISEINTGLSSATDEYVELYNFSSTSVNMSGWALQKIASTGSASYLVSSFAGVIINPFSYFLIAHPDYTPLNGASADKNYTNTSNNLSADKNGVVLFNQGNIEDVLLWGEVSTTYSCGTNIDKPEAGKSLVRRPDNDNGNGEDTDNCSVDFFAADPSPQNSASPVRPLVTMASSSETSSTADTQSPSSTNSVASSSIFDYSLWTNIKINEFVSDPEIDNEWVELFNNATGSIDVAGGFLCDSRNTTSTCKSTSGTVPGNGWLKIDLLTDSYLNNGGDSVILKNPLGEIIDQIVYTGSKIPAKGQALARNQDGVDTDSDADWQITTQPTPGMQNNIVSPVVSHSGSSSGGGSAGSNSTSNVVVVTSSKKIVTSTKPAVIKEKFVGLKWKISYNVRLRQNAISSFDASKTLDPRGGRINYMWDFGDDIVPGSNVQYTFASSGIHEVVVHATSTAGTVDSKKITIMVYPATTTVGSGIIFNKVLPRATGDEDEYIELKNISDQTINMSNWKLVYKNDVYEIPTSTSVAANDYLIFYQTISGFTLNNTEGELLLLNADNILMDTVEYNKAPEGAAYIFDGQGWVWDLPTSSGKVLGIKISNSTSKKSSAKLLTNIATVRTGQKGDYAKITGVVSVLPGVFGSQYFYLNNESNGVQIYQSKKDFPPLAVGDMVRVQGTVSEANGIKRVNAKNSQSVDILSIDNIVTSTELNLDELDDSRAGALVQIEGEITSLKSNFMYVDNGQDEIKIYFKQGAKLDKQKLKVGEKVDVTGILEKTAAEWQVWPRSSDDLAYLGMASDTLGAATDKNSDGVAEKYLTATAGGVTTLILAFLARARGAMLLGGIKKVIAKLIKKEIV